MAKLVILGSSSAVPDEDHENTHLAVVDQEKTLLIDCAGSPLVRLPAAGIVLDSITDLVLTHFHADHVSGTPQLLMNLWLLGRRRPLDIYGLAHTLDNIERLMVSYDWSSWPNFFPVTFHRLPEQEMALVFENEAMRVFSSPVQHLIPTIGLRIELLASGHSLAYSCDTEPCPQVVRLGSQVDVMVHEATGEYPGHSSAVQAAQVAAQAQAKQLYLIHYNARGSDLERLVEEASQAFPGKVSLAKDFMQIEL